MKSAIRKICVLGDSLGMERSFDRGVSYDNTWPVILGHYFYRYGIRISNLCERAREMTSVPQDIIRNRDADIFIVQAGIVDCALRIMSKEDNAAFNSLRPYLRDYLLECINGKRAEIMSRMPEEITYTSRESFHQAVAESLILTKKYNATIIFIEILGHSNYLIGKKIPEYNEIFEEETQQFSHAQYFRLLNAKEAEDRIFHYDGYHLSKDGNILLAQKLISFIEALKRG